MVEHPVYGRYSVVVLSRDEYRRVAERDHAEMVSQYPGRYRAVDVVDYKPGEESLQAQANQESELAKSKMFGKGKKPSSS